MISFLRETWHIQSIIDGPDEQISESDDSRIEIHEGGLTIHPANLRFTFREIDGDHAVLESEDHQIYQARFSFDDENIQLEMCMPGLEERVVIVGTASRSNCR